MESKILFRQELSTEQEYFYAKKYFDVRDSRIDLKDTLVVGRYSVLPYYSELEKDLKRQGSQLINSFEQHKYIADFEYYADIKDITPKTYFDTTIANLGEGPFVVKGKTNSKKFDWDNLMFAKDKQRALEIAHELSKDSLLHYQDIIIRDFVPLNVLEEGINGLPFSNEWRFFCYKEHILSYGFYWSISEEIGVLAQEGIDLVKKVMKRVKGKVNFFVVDVAEKEDGSWIVIEMNDGQMSGLSDNSPDVLYSNLAKILKEEECL